MSLHYWIFAICFAIIPSLGAAVEFVANFKSHVAINAKHSSSINTSNEMPNTTFSCWVKNNRSRYQVKQTSESVRRFAKKATADTSYAFSKFPYLFSVDSGKTVYSIIPDKYYDVSGNPYLESFIENKITTYSKISSQKTLDKLEKYQNLPVRHLQIKIDYLATTNESELEKMMLKMNPQLAAMKMKRRDYQLPTPPPRMASMMIDLWFATDLPAVAGVWQGT